jgi:CRISPR-associated endonuclease Cas2
MALTHVIAYDISDDGRRARVAAVLQAHGDRVQRSVFVCTLEADILQVILFARTDHSGVVQPCRPDHQPAY